MPGKAVLRKVVHRKPVPYLQHPDREDAKLYLGVYVVETLECNHKINAYPACDSLIAVRRRCNRCEEEKQKIVPISAPKKGPQSVAGAGAQEESA